MNLIAIDTTTELASVALKLDDKITSLEQNSVRQHAQFLLPMIEKLMNNAALPWNELHGIVFGAGPGSFTGLRIACSMAKALAYAHQLPVYAVNSMEALAYQVREILPAALQTNGILTILDARMQEVYWAYFPPEVQQNVMIQVSKVADISLAANDKIVVVGTGFETYEDQWPSAVLKQMSVKYSMVPLAETLLEMVTNVNVPATSAELALPLYIRNQVTHSRGVHG